MYREQACIARSDDDDDDRTTAQRRRRARARLRRFERE